MPKRLAHTPGDIQSLFIRLEELIVAASGADVFEETLKLVAAKLFDEAVDGSAFEMGSLEELNNAVAGAARTWRGILEAPLLLQLPPATAQHCAVLLRGYKLQKASDTLDLLFETLVSHTAKGSKGQFFTPRYIVDFCVRLIRPAASAAIVDPACGSGAFLSTALQYGADVVHGFDIDPRAVRIAKLLLVSRGWYPSCIQQADALRDLQPESADVILTNPPFAGEVIDADLLAQFELAKGRDRVERDVLFLERCIKALRPGGILAIILPHSKFAGPGTKYVREWLFANARVLAVIGLGRNTFLPHTHQKANILVAQRRTAPQNGHTERIFFAQSERDAKNTRGQYVGDHDLEEILDAYRAHATRS